jgi:diguanylate cyclase (GGDEF)-like protein
MNNKPLLACLLAAGLLTASASESDIAASEPAVATALDTRDLANGLGRLFDGLGIAGEAMFGARGGFALIRLEAHALSALHAVGAAADAWSRVETMARASGDLTEAMYALERETEYALLLSDYTRARQLASRLLDSARTAASNEYEASAHGYFGILARRQGDLDAALKRYETAIGLLAGSGNDFRKALILSNLGTVMRDRGDFARALELQLDALAIRERIGDRLETSLRNVALLYREIEDEATARSYFERALDSADRLGNPETYAPVLGSYASLLNDIGEHAAALAAASEALQIDLALGNRANQGLERLETGRAQFGLGRNEVAAQQLEAALGIGRELDQHEIVSRALLHLAEISQARHESLQARGMIDEAIAGLEKAQLRPQLVQAYAVREKIALAEHDPEAALRYLRRYAEQRELLLGTRAGRQLSDLRARHARAEAEKDLSLLQKDNELQNARLQKQEIEKRLGLVALTGLGLALLLITWRFHGISRLNRTLRLKNAEIDRQREALTHANARLEERAAELYQAAITDPLTGAYNRSHLRERVARTLAACIASRRPLAVLVLDYDSFKQINDQLGHLFGDRVLVAGIAAIRQCLEEGEVLGRFGGEEFIVVLEGERALAAVGVAEAIRSQAQESLSQLPTRGIAVTLSIGIAALSDLPVIEEASVDALFDAGDQAMYRAKAAGRNRVALFSRATHPIEELVRGRDPSPQ